MVDGFHVAGLGQDHHPVAWLLARHLAKDAMFYVLRFEQVGVPQQHFRLAQEEKARVAEPKVKTGKDPFLGIAIEIDQGIATDEQVQARDRRILEQIVAAKNDGTPQIVAEDVACWRVLKVSLA